MHVHIICHVQAFRYLAIIIEKTSGDFLALVVVEETNASSAALVAGAPNDINSVMDSVDRKAVAGKVSVDGVFFMESILWLTVAVATVSVS